MASELAIEIARLQGWTQLRPEPDRNLTDCMMLLQYVTELPEVWQIMTEHLDSLHYVRIDGYQRKFNASASDKEFRVAIALACRDALRAIAEVAP